MTKRSTVSRATSTALVQPSASSSRLAERLASADFQREYDSLAEYDVAENIVRLRRHRGMTQRALAEVLGTKQPAIARIEAGAANPRLATLKEIAAALDARLRILFAPSEFTFPELPAWWDCLEAGLAMPSDSVHISFVGTMNQAGIAGHVTLNQPPELAQRTFVSISNKSRAGLLAAPLAGEHA